MLRHKPFAIYLLPLAMLLASLAQAAPTVWVSPSLVRVGQNDAAGTTTSVSLSAARGETVSTQVIARGPTSGLTNVNVSASSLTGPNGATIMASNIVLFREYYVTVNGTVPGGGGSNPPLGSGTYAEPLIPFNDPQTGTALCGSSASLKACNAGVGANQNQPYWIDISIPRGAANSPAGTYTGTITVTSDQGNVIVPVTLTVWSFELPVQPTELSLWTLWSPNSGDTVPSLDHALMRNKVMGWYDNASSAASDMTNFGLNRSGLDATYFIGIQCNGSFSSSPSAAQIATAAASFPSGLPLDLYAADELNGCTAAYPPIKTLATNAHANGVKVGMTTNAPDPNLYGFMDNWILLMSQQQWPSLPFTNGALWSYTSCNVGFGNTPEWMIDYPPINERLTAGFLNQTQGATGILYYRADGWSSGNTIGSWNTMPGAGDCGGGTNGPGDGVFVYPPGPIGSSEPAPGIRLKAIRDGVQDYEYVQLLKNAGQASFANSVIQPIATSWTNWTKNPTTLEAARLQLGQKLNSFSAPPPPPPTGCGQLGQIFPSDNAWNTDISTWPVHPNSANYVNSVGTSGSLHPDFGTIYPPGSGIPWGIPYIVVHATEPLVPINFVAYGNESDPGPYPMPLSAPIEGGPASTGDRHVISVNVDTRKLYELFNANPGTTQWNADSGAVFDLTSNALRPAGWTSADAAGLPILPGLVRHDEVACGVINHALRLTIQNSQAAYIFPARHFASSNTNLNLPPMGLRFRLKANVDISGYPAEEQVILTALKKYGWIVADNGSNWYLSGAPDPGWNDNNINLLKQIHGSDFEVVDTTGAAGGSHASSLCDVNADGVVDVRDVQWEVNMVLQSIPCTNPSGTCTVAGVQKVVNAVLSGTCVVGP